MEDGKEIKIECKVQAHGFDGVEISQEIQQNEKAQVANAQLQKIAKKQFTDRIKELSGNSLNKAYKHYCNVALKAPEKMKKEEKIAIIKDAIDNLEESLINKLYLQYGSNGTSDTTKRRDIKNVLKDANAEELLYFVATFKPARKTATKKEEAKTETKEEPQTAATEDNGEATEI